MGLAVYWISACSGQDAVPISEIHDILTLYDFHLSDQAAATRMSQLEEEGLDYYRERSGSYDGFQLTVPGFERYDELSGGCPGMMEDSSTISGDTAETRDGRGATSEADNNSYDVFRLVRGLENVHSGRHPHLLRPRRTHTATDRDRPPRARPPRIQSG